MYGSFSVRGSNLPFLSKILEKIVLARLSRYLVGNGLLEPLQSGYRSNHSTETALLKLVNDLLCSADEGKVSVLALLDLSSTFDTIDHEVLLKRQNDTYGTEGTVLNWFHSYLSERAQSVSFCGRASRAHQLLYGVPQGSVLGPVLFSLYTQPLASVIKCHDILYHFYANDAELHSSCPPTQLDVMCDRLSFCMDDIKGWTIKNKLKLNED